MKNKNYENQDTNLKTELIRRNKEIFSLSMVVGFLIFIIWLVINLKIVDIIGTILLIIFYIIQTLEIINYHSAFIYFARMKERMD